MSYRDSMMAARVPNPRPLEAALRDLRHLCRQRSRRAQGSRRYVQAQNKITRLQRRVAEIRGHHVHNLTTRIAKTHSVIVVEGLDAAGMLRQMGLPGARARRRGLSDSALGETRRQRDDNAAVNLARYEQPPAGDSAVGPVGAAVKRRADRKTGPRPAGGNEARKGRSHAAAEQPRDGVPV